MEKQFLTCLLAAAAILLQAQTMKPQRLEQYTWDEAGQKWVADYTDEMKYNATGNLIYVSRFDNKANSPDKTDTLLYNAQGKVVSTISSRWNPAQNSFVFDNRMDNCYDAQLRDCGVSNYKWNGNSWGFTGGYQQSYTASNANNSLTQMLRVWNNNTQQFEPENSFITFYKSNGSKASVESHVRNPATGFLVPYTKDVYAGWHDEASGMATATETFNHNGTAWVLGQKQTVEDSGMYWKITFRTAANVVNAYSRKAKDGSFTESYIASNNTLLLNYTRQMDGLTETEQWFTYGANNNLQMQHKVITERNLQGDVTVVTSMFWEPATGWYKDTENTFAYTYDAQGNIAEIVATIFDADAGINQKDYRLVYSNYVQVGQPANPCGISPTVTGELLICPDDVTTLSTQQYDSYQWYTRPYGSTIVPEASPGDTTQNFVVSSNMGPMYVSVKVTDDTCTATSPEVLVDGRVFLPLTVTSFGDFSVTIDGEQVICPGESITMVVNLPFTQNFVWFDGNDPIPGGNDDTLVVTQPGNYWVVASPAECPNWADALGTPITVIYDDPQVCTTGFIDAPRAEAKIYPNPVGDWLHIEVPQASATKVVVYDMSGRSVIHKRFAQSTEIDVSGLERGMYLVDVMSDMGKTVTKLQVK